MQVRVVFSISHTASDLLFRDRNCAPELFAYVDDIRTYCLFNELH